MRKICLDKRCWIFFRSFIQFGYGSVQSQPCLPYVSVAYGINVFLFTFFFSNIKIVGYKFNLIQTVHVFCTINNRYFCLMNQPHLSVRANTRVFKFLRIELETPNNNIYVSYRVFVCDVGTAQVLWKPHECVSHVYLYLYFPGTQNMYNIQHSMM